MTNDTVAGWYEQPSSSAAITAADLQRAFQQMWNFTPRPVPYDVNADEAVWIKNPEGEPPTTHAVMVAMTLGTIQAGHPAVDAVMATFHERESEEQP